MKIPDSPPLPAKLESESEIEYSLLCLYCLLGVRRSHEKVSEVYYRQATEIDQNRPERPSLSWIKEISRKNNWVLRAKDYDILCLRFERTKLSLQAAEESEEWLETMNKSEKVMQGMINALLEQVTEYSIISEARKDWLKRNSKKLKSNPQLLSQATALEIDGLAVLDKSTKLFKELWFTRDQSKINDLVDKMIIEGEFVYGDDKFDVEKLKKGE